MRHARPAASGTSSGSPSPNQRLQSETVGSSNNIWMSGNWVPAAASGSPAPAAPEMRAGAAQAALYLAARVNSLEAAANHLPDLVDESDPSPPPDEEGFPSQLALLSRLRTLSMSCCDLEAVPPVVGRLTSLRSLVISGNRPHATRHAFFFLPSDCRSLVVRHPPHPAASYLVQSCHNASLIRFCRLQTNTARRLMSCVSGMQCCHSFHCVWIF